MFENQPYDFATLFKAVKQFKEDITIPEVRDIQSILWSKYVYRLNEQAKEIILDSLKNIC